MSKVFYFAIAGGSYDPETGEHDEAGLRIAIDGVESAEEAAAIVEQHMPCYTGRMRQITEEEYIRAYGEDE